jgi:hypothetical protein
VIIKWSRLWSYGGWIDNYLCNQFLSPLVLWVRLPLMARRTTLCDKVCQWLGAGRWFSPRPLFPPPINWPPRYNWNSVESGVKHYKTNQPIIMYLQRNHNWVVVRLVLTPTLSVFQLYRGVNRNWRYDLQRDMNNYTLLIFYTILFNCKATFIKIAYSNVNSCSIMI